VALDELSEHDAGNVHREFALNFFTSFTVFGEQQLDVRPCAGVSISALNMRQLRLCAEFVIGGSESCDYPQISFVIHHNIPKQAHCCGWGCVRMVKERHLHSFGQLP
jgi:hypothetical protein